MKEPQWVRIDVLLATHKEIIAEHGGVTGVRDINLLESACASPKQAYHYKNPKPTIYELAAKYACNMTRGHPFTDGNKRMAALTCELFLALNQYDLIATDEAAYFVFKDLAAGEMTEEELTKWLKEHVICISVT
jgi:death on curing protein